MASPFLDIVVFLCPLMIAIPSSINFGSDMMREFGTYVTFLRSRYALFLSRRGTSPVVVMNCVFFKAPAIEIIF
eukprot:snap_masked-scaffold_46-processed-gene-1.69-mRNA-1 protein AED:1.00 eAED:1.00 QI:0/0/0/0/1/1/2/0/73